MRYANIVVVAPLSLVITASSTSRASEKGIIDGMINYWKAGSATNKIDAMRTAATVSGDAAQLSIGSLNYYSKNDNKSKSEGIRTAVCGISSFHCSYADAAIKVGTAVGKETEIVDRMQYMDFRSEEFANQFKSLNQQRIKNREDIKKALPDNSIDVVAESIPVIDAIFAIGGALISIRSNYFNASDQDKDAFMKKEEDASSQNTDKYTWRVKSIETISNGQYQRTPVPNELKGCILGTSSLDPLEMLKEIGNIKSMTYGSYGKCGAPFYKKVSSSEADGSISCELETKNGTDGPDRNYLLPPGTPISRTKMKVDEAVKISKSHLFTHGSETAIMGETAGARNGKIIMLPVNSKILSVTEYELCN